MATSHAAVCGSPIAHSLSPVLHSAAYGYLGVDADYRRWEVTESELGGVLASLDRAWLGLSLTMPLKEVALTLISNRESIVDDVGAANTIYRTPDGEWALANTDVEGARFAIERARTTHPDTRIRERPLKSALVLGAGATARSVVRALVDLGVQHLTIAARRLAAAHELGDRARAWGVTAVDLTFDDLSLSEWSSDVVVSTVPGDASGFLGDQVRQLALVHGGVLLDVAYHPWPTALADAWPGPVASGRDMLIGQAVRQISLMTGKDVPVDVLYAALADYELGKTSH